MGTLSGVAAGMFLPLLMGVSLQNVPLAYFFFAPLTVPITLLSAVIGYETTERGGSHTRVQPVVSFTPRGASFGLAGTF